MLQQLTGKYITSNGIRFYVRDEGQGEPVLFLHGFPDTGDVWRHQAECLLEEGYRVIIPDLRGRGRTEKPLDVAGYAMGNLMQDVVGILNALGLEQVHVVSHDFGAPIGWALAAFCPNRVKSHVPITVGVLTVEVLSAQETWEKGWYRLLFMMEGKAEALLTQNDWKLFRQVLHNAPDMESYLENLSEPGALTAALNYYRATNAVDIMLSPPGEPFPQVSVPTLGVFGSEDPFVPEEIMTDSERFMTGEWDYVRFQDTGHWVQLDEAKKFNTLLLSFLRKHRM